MTAPDINRPTAVYRFFGDDGRLLYVGITHNLGTRFSAHERSSPWWPDQRVVSVVWLPSRQEAAEAERTAIRNEDPVWNKSGRKEPRIRTERLDPEIRRLVAMEVRVAIARSGLPKSVVRDYLGLSRQSMWQRVDGQIAFNSDELEALAELLGVTVEQFYDFPA